MNTANDPSHSTKSGTKDCPNGANQGGNYADSACIGDGSTTYLGASAYWDNVNLSFKPPAVNGDHINNHLWFYTATDYSTLVEMGLDYGGCITVGGQPYGNTSCFNWPSTCQPCYEVMWDDHDRYLNEYDHYISGPPQNASVHEYDIQQNGSNSQYWDIYYDGVYEGTSTVTGSSAGYEAQVGLEVANDPALSHSIAPFHAATFHNSTMETESTNGIWYSWSYLNYWRDRPCRLGYLPPECTNGSTNKSAIPTWYTNKPWNQGAEVERMNRKRHALTAFAGTVMGIVVLLGQSGPGEAHPTSAQPPPLAPGQPAPAAQQTQFACERLGKAVCNSNPVVVATDAANDPLSRPPTPTPLI